VIARHTGLEAEVLVEMTAHALAEELLPAVAVLGHGGVGVGLLQSGDVGSRLLVGRVHAGGGGVEEALDAEILGRLEHVGVDQDREHAQRLVVLDEAHPAHVGGEVVDAVRPLERPVAGIPQGEIELDALGRVKPLMPFLERLQVDGEDVVTSVEEIRHEVATYETACSRDDNSFSARTHRGPPDVGDFASCRIRLPCLRAIGRAPAVPYQRVSCFRWRYPMARVPHLAFNR
jgi:hypothetical protein